MSLEEATREIEKKRVKLQDITKHGRIEMKFRGGKPEKKRLSVLSNESLFGVVYHFLVEIVRNIADEEDREGDDLLSV